MLHRNLSYLTIVHHGWRQLMAPVHTWLGLLRLSSMLLE